MERGLTMLFHSVIICIILYCFMVYTLGQNPAIAENRSLLLSSLTLIYMLLFGHKLPTSINKNIF